MTIDKEDDLEDILEDDKKPNLVFTYPTFYLKKYPDDIFVIEDIFWIAPFDEVVKEDVSEQTKAMIAKTTQRVYEVEQLGIVHNMGILWRLRDMDQPLLPSIISAEHIPTPIKTFLISGPRYDMRSIEQKMATVH